MKRDSLASIVFRDHLLAFRKFLRSHSAKEIVFPSELKITSKKICHAMDEIVVGGRVIIGLHGEIRWSPPNGYRLYSLGGREDGSKRYFMLKDRKEKEIIFAGYSDGKIVKTDLSDGMLQAIKKEIFG